MEILKYPHPCLRKRCKEVKEIDAQLIERVREMLDAMYKSNGIGLAAAQVGWDARLFVLNVSGSPDGELVFINPRILEKEGTINQEEGCLSVPGVYGKVTRAEKVVVQAFDLQGEAFELESDGLLAIAIQHENDHLDGNLFITRLTKASRIAIKQQIRDMEEDFKAEHPDEQPITCPI